MASWTPGAHWIKYGDLDPTQREHYLLQMGCVLHNANWEYLAVKLCHIRTSMHRASSAVGGPCPEQMLSYSVQTTTFLLGTHTVIYPLLFADGTTWLIKIWRTPPAADYDHTAFLRETTVMNLVKHRTSIPVPTVYSCDGRRDNPFGFPHIVMESMPGHRLKYDLAACVPKEVKSRAAGQLASIVWQLGSITFDRCGFVMPDRSGDTHSVPVHRNADNGNGMLPGYDSITNSANSTNSTNNTNNNDASTGKKKPNTGIHSLDRVKIVPLRTSYGAALGPFETSQDYLQGLLTANNKHIQDRYGSDPEEMPHYGLYIDVQKLAAPHMLCSGLERGPFPLHHGRLDCNNILVDDEFNITGVLGWDEAKTVPIEFFSVVAQLRTPPQSADEVVASTKAFTTTFIEAYRELEESVPVQHLWRLSHIINSKLPQLIYLWDIGIPDNAYRALAHASAIFKLLYGVDLLTEREKALDRFNNWDVPALGDSLTITW